MFLRLDEEEIVSKDSRNTRLALVAATFVAAIVMMMAWSGTDPTGDGIGPHPIAQAPAAGDARAAGSPSLLQRRSDQRAVKDPAAEDAQAAEYLRQQFGATIANKHTQIKAIEKLIGYLMKNYPDDWQQRVQAVLAQAFPGLAAQLYGQYQNMSAYNDWLRANREQLAEMSPGDKRAALRDARFRFFGADAAEIWEESLRHEQIYDAMDAIGQSTDTTVEQKLSTYLDAINQTYGEQAPEFIERRQTELMTNFLTLPSVQDDLHAMDAQAREGELDRIRGAMGLDEAARDRWHELDGQRDQAWENGERYMEKRDEITAAWQGDEQARRLQELRSQMFGDEAETIRGEEESGFFRFGHRRVYGRE